MLLLCLVLLVAIVVIYPLINIGYVEDDTVTSLRHVSATLLNQSFFDEVWNATLGILRGQGRFNPLLQLAMTCSFRIFPSAEMYKISILVTSIVGMLTFYWFLRVFGATPAFARLSILLTALCFQFRSYHDPFIAYHNVMQIPFILVIVSLTSLQLFLNTRKPFLIAASLIAYMTGCLAYDSCLSLIGLHVIVLWLAPKSKEKIAATTGYTVVYGVMAAISIAAKLQAHLPADSPYAVSLNAEAIARTFIYQLTAGLPLSYWLGHTHTPDMSQLLSTSFILQAFSQNAIAFSLLIFFVPLAFISCFPTMNTNKHSNLLFVLMALCLMVLPSLPLALCRKYQDELTWGLGNMQVFMQYFGFGLLAALACQLFLQRNESNKKVQVCAYALLCLFCLPVFLLTSFGNVLVADSLQPMKDRRENLSAALESGILDRVPERSQITFRSPEPFRTGAPWEGTAFLFAGSKKLFSVKNENAMYREQLEDTDKTILSRSEKPAAEHPQRYCLRNFWSGRNAGFVVLTNENPKVSFDEVLFVRGKIPAASELELAGITGPLADRMRLLKEGHDWKLFELKQQY